jgi:hypothetical protein
MRETLLTSRQMSVGRFGMPPRLFDAALRLRARRLVQSFMGKPMIPIAGSL